MCGIIGAVNLSLSENSVKMLSHRGPDDFGFEKLVLNGFSVSFGHTRLSIQDLSSSGHQPMFSSRGVALIVFNGEIYNHLSLRDKMSDVHFRGHSDTETIVNLIEKYGVDKTREFNGIFAFVVLDTKRCKLYLARDPFGVKPLYYCHENNTFVFASEIKPILSLVKGSLDRQNLAELLRVRYSPSPDTLFTNIHKVRPGHILEVDLSKESILKREYSFIEEVPNTLMLPFSDAVNRYRQLFDDSVKRQLLSDVEIGVLLSGGIDSALVASCAQKKTSYRMKAFTIGFKDKDASDEIDDAKATAEVLGLEHFSEQITFKDFHTIFRKCTEIVEEPLATTSIIPMFYLAEMASKHVKVVLSGQGADEPLGGYLRYQGLIYSELIPRPLFLVLKRLFKGLGVKNEKLLKAVHSLGERDEFKQLLNIYSVFTDSEIRELIGLQESKSQEKIRYFYDIIRCEKKKRRVERMMSLDLRMNLADDLLLYTDKITMHFSLECRVPILDHVLVHFLESLPCNYKVGLGRTKIIHKKYAETELPPFIINRKKKGFQSPTESWFRLNEETISEILLSRTSKFSQVFNLEMVKKVLSQHRQMLNREKQIFLLLSIHNWMESFV